MSHDLRTPITGIMGILQDFLRLAIKTEEKLDSEILLSVDEKTQLLQQMVDELDENSQVALGSIDSLLQLCNEILEVTKLESGKVEAPLEAFDLLVLKDSVINLLQPTAKDKKLTLEKSIDPNIPQYVFGSGKYLNKILLNLISNALKFTKEGCIKLYVDLKDKAKRFFKKGDAITLTFIVEDTGLGIPADKLRRFLSTFQN